MVELNLEVLDRVVRRAENATDACRGYVVLTGKAGLTVEQIEAIKKALSEVKKEKS